jgi:radical SAM protein with 4Fe4S-binding SPASM domain
MQFIIRDGYRFIRTLTWGKILNLLKVRVFYIFSIYSKYSGIPAYPSFVSIEPTNFCNLNCPECPRAHHIANGRGNMDMATYKKIIDELGPYLLNLLLYFQGEPFLHPAIFEMITYAKKRNIYITMSTNGHFIKQNPEEIIKSGLDKLIVSVDGVSEEMYKNYRVGGNLNTVKGGVENLIQLRSRKRKQHPAVIMQTIITRFNEGSLKEFIKMGNYLGVDKVIFKTAQVSFPGGEDLIPREGRFSRYLAREGKTLIKKKIKNRCIRLWQTAVINYKGEVLPCCYDKTSSFVMGSARDEAFHNIYNNKKYLSFRKKVLTNQKGCEMCKACGEGIRGGVYIRWS